MRNRLQGMLFILACLLFSSCSFQSRRENKPDTESTSRAFCTVSISCAEVLENKEKLNEDKKEFIPEDGWILKPEQVEFESGETAYSLLSKLCKEKGIQMESEYSPAYNTHYIEGMGQLYVADCGPYSGWVYLVNGESVDYGCSQYKIVAGDRIEWNYICSMGEE